MDLFENELRRALQRRQPPGDLFVVAAHERRLPNWRWATALAVVIIVVVAVWTYERERRYRLDGERVKQQVLLALRITQAKLQTVQDRLIEVQR